MYDIFTPHERHFLALLSGFDFEQIKFQTKNPAGFAEVEDAGFTKHHTGTKDLQTESSIKVFVSQVLSNSGRSIWAPGGSGYRYRRGVGVARA